MAHMRWTTAANRLSLCLVQSAGVGMAMDKVIDKVMAPLTRVEAFRGLTEGQLQELARHAKKLKFLRGDVITRAGSPGDGALIIASGPAEREANRNAPAEIVPPGSLIGEMAMLIPHDYTVTVLARDWVYCLKITRAALHAQMSADPSLAEHFRQRVTARMMRFAEDLRRIDRLLAAQGAHAADRAGALVPA
jgi:CRP-like cAMP-binding protein